MHGEDGGIKEKMRAWKRIWKALLCSLLFYSRKNMKYDGAIVEYSKLETFYMVKALNMLENSVVQGFFRARAAGVNLDLADICTAAAHKG